MHGEPADNVFFSSMKGLKDAEIFLCLLPAQKRLMPAGQRGFLKKRWRRCTPLGLRKCGSKVHRQDGSKRWTVKSLAGRASPYRIRDSISLRCPLKPVQPVVLGRGWVTGRLCLGRQTLENSSSCCLKALRDPRLPKSEAGSISRGATQGEASLSPSIRPAGAGHCFNQSEGEAPGSCSWGLMEGSSPEFPDMIEMTALRSDTVAFLNTKTDGCAGARFFPTGLDGEG